MASDLRIPDDLAAKLEERVASGAAASAVDVVREGLAALEAEDARRLNALREKVARSMADPRSSVSSDDAFNRVEALLANINRK